MFTPLWAFPFSYPIPLYTRVVRSRWDVSTITTCQQAMQINITIICTPIEHNGYTYEVIYYRRRLLLMASPGRIFDGQNMESVCSMWEAQWWHLSGHMKWFEECGWLTVMRLHGIIYGKCLQCRGCYTRPGSEALVGSCDLIWCMWLVDKDDAAELISLLQGWETESQCDK